MHGIGSSKLKRKFQAALPDSQINDSKVMGLLLTDGVIGAARIVCRVMSM